MELSLPRGVRDIGPDEFSLHEKILSAFSETARLFCFKMMEPSTIETAEVLTAKSGTDILNELYSFKDKAGRDVGLRFDLTVGLTRYVCSRKDLPLPLKLASQGYVWRYDEPQHARYRSFKQWDVEIFDKNTVDSDAEVIEFTYRLLKKLGIDLTIEIGHRGVAEELARKKTGLSKEEVVEALRILDKAQKKRKEELVKEYTQKGFTKEKVEKVLSISELRGGPEDVLGMLSSYEIENKELYTLCDMLKGRGVKMFSLNIGIVRGLDYYTGIVFEVFDKAKKDVGSICGGGRYNILPKIFGREDVSATGVAGGVERIAMSLSQSKEETKRPVLVTYAGEDMYSDALGVLRLLRDLSLPSEIAPLGYTLRKQMDFASSEKARFVVIVGSRDLREGLVTLRDMDTGEEVRVATNKVAEKINQLFSRN